MFSGYPQFWFRFRNGTGNRRPHSRGICYEARTPDTRASSFLERMPWWRWWIQHGSHRRTLMNGTQRGTNSNRPNLITQAISQQNNHPRRGSFSLSHTHNARHISSRNRAQCETIRSSCTKTSICWRYTEKNRTCWKESVYFLPLCLDSANKSTVVSMLT